MNKIYHAYYTILLEEILLDDSIINRISNFPSPLNSYFNKMRLSMLSASLVKSDIDLTRVNSDVNFWRDKIMKYWIRNSSKLDPEIKTEINDVLMLMIDRYTSLMGGINTGYSNVG